MSILEEDGKKYSKSRDTILNHRFQKGKSIKGEYTPSSFILFNELPSEYVIYEKNNSGGMGFIGLCKDKLNKKFYVLKTYQYDDSSDMFKEEIEFALKLEKHPHIVYSQTALKEKDRIYLVMELVGKQPKTENEEWKAATLTQELQKEKGISTELSYKWAIEFCRGMQYLNSIGMKTHGDITPNNIFITEDRHIKVADFGFATLKGGKAKRGGTEIYYSPEHYDYDKECDIRSDIYSFGIILYEMFNAGINLKSKTRITNSDIKSNFIEVSKINSKHCNEIIKKCLQPKQEERYQTFKELEKDLLKEAKKEIGKEFEVEELPIKESNGFDYFNKATAYDFVLDDYNNAKNFYFEALKKDFRLDFLYSKISLEMRKNKYEEALEDFNIYEIIYKPDKNNLREKNNGFFLEQIRGDLVLIYLDYVECNLKLNNYMDSLILINRIQENNDMFNFEKIISLLELKDFKQAVLYLETTKKCDIKDYNYIISSLDLSYIINNINKLKELTDKIESDTNNSYLYEQRALINTNLNAYQDAINDYETILKLNPLLELNPRYRNGDILNKISELKLKVGDYIGAFENRRLYAIKFNPYCILFAKMIEEDIKFIKDILNDYIKVLDINFAIQENTGLENKYKLLEKIDNDISLNAENNEDNIINYFKRAKIKKDLKDYNGALDDIKKILLLNYKSDEILMFQIPILLGNIYFLLNQYQEALNSYNRALEVNPSNSFVYILIGTLKYLFFFYKDYDLVINEYNKYIKLYPNNSYLYRLRGKVHTKFKKYASALKDYDKAIQLDNNTDYYYIERAKLKNIMKDYKGVIQDYNSILQIRDHEYVSGKINMEFFKQLTEFEKEITDACNMIFNDPKYTSSSEHFYKGNLYVTTENYEKAVSEYKQSVNLYPEYYEKRKKFKETQKFKDAINKYKFDHEILDYKITEKEILTIIFKKEEKENMEKQYKEILQYYDRAIKLNPKEYFWYILRANLIQEYKETLEKNDDNKIILNNLNDEIVTNYNEAIILSPKYYKTYLLRANVFLESLKIDEALDDVLTAEKYYKKEYHNETDTKLLENIRAELVSLYDKQALHNLALEQYNEAIENYDKALKVISEDDTIYNRRALAKERVKQYEEALKDFSEAIKINPDKSNYYSNRGKLYYSLNENEKALKDFNKAIELNLKKDSLYYIRGLIKKRLKQYNDAIEDYNEAIKINPNKSDYYSNRGLLYYYLHRNEKALKDFNSAIELNSKKDSLYYIRGLIKESFKQCNDAIEDYNEAIKINPNKSDYYYNRGKLYYTLNEKDKALKDFDKAIAIEPNYVDVYIARGKIKDNLKQYQQAIEDYNKAIELNPTEINAYFRRAKTKEYLKQYQQAIEDYDKVIQLDSTVATVYNQKTYCYLYMNQIEDAFKSINKALELEENDSGYIDTLGDIYKYIKEYDKAIEQYKKAIKMNKNQIPSYNSLIEIYKLLGKEKEAKEIEEKLNKIKKV